MIEEVKRQNAKKTEFDRIAEMDYDDLLHNYSEIISAKESGDLNSPYYKPNKTEYRIKLEKAVVKRYEEVKDLPRETNVSKYTLQKVDPFFKAKIDRMNQKELEEYYPGLKFSPIAPILDHNYYSSETDKANDIYLAARYQELDSQNPISKHDPNFEQKRFEYIAETGLDPVTGKEADEELLNYATNYTKYAPSIKAGYDFLMVGTAAWSTRAYNKDIQTQRADAQINEYYKIKDAVRTQSVGSQSVVPEVGLTKGINVSPDNMVEGIPKEIGMPENANYAQKTYSNSFSEIGREKYSELAGEPINTIDDLVDSINTKKISISELPVEYIERDGHTLILNTRTSQALTQAGIPRSEWFTIDRTGNSLYESLLDGQLKRNKLTSEGISEVRPSTRKGN